MEQEPSANEFVVQGPPPGSAVANSEPESVHPKQQLDDSGASLIEFQCSSKDPRVAWQQLLADYAGAQWAAPVLVDGGGSKHFPTGDVTVRLKRAFSDDELNEFAVRHGLEMRDRNEFVAEQASFRPTDLRKTFLPDLVFELEKEEDVSAVWANTRSYYER